MGATELYSHAWYQEKKDLLNTLYDNPPSGTNCYNLASQIIGDLESGRTLSRWESCGLAALAMNINPDQSFDTYRTAPYVPDNLRQIVMNTLGTGWQDCTATSSESVTFADLEYELAWKCTQAPFITGGGSSWGPVGLEYAKEKRDLAIDALDDWQFYSFGYGNEALRASYAAAADSAVAAAASAQQAVYNAPDPRWTNVFNYIGSAPSSIDRDYYIWDGEFKQLFRWVFKNVKAVTTYKRLGSSYTQWRHWDEGPTGWNIYPRYWDPPVGYFSQPNLFEFGSGPSGQLFFLGDIPLVRLLMGLDDVPPYPGPDQGSTCTGRGPGRYGDTPYEENTRLYGITSYDFHFFEET